MPASLIPSKLPLGGSGVPTPQDTADLLPSATKPVLIDPRASSRTNPKQLKHSTVPLRPRALTDPRASKLRNRMSGGRYDQLSTG
jgi:hypothetical protein